MKRKRGSSKRLFLPAAGLGPPFFVTIFGQTYEVKNRSLAKVVSTPKKAGKA